MVCNIMKHVMRSPMTANKYSSYMYHKYTDFYMSALMNHANE